MKVVTATENYRLNDDEISVFLAGGITNCPEWQDKVIDLLRSKPDTDKLVVFNPRRKNFPIDDKMASYKQIEWEFNQLEKVAIFSIYFAGGDSVQPICLYELGRNILRIQNRFPSSWNSRIIVSVSDNYIRKQDVIYQTGLATNNIIPIHTQMTDDVLVNYHASYIYSAYMKLLNQ